MKRDIKKEALEAFAKKLSSGNYASGDLIIPDRSLAGQAFEARNLAEQTLANEFLKNTGISVPDKLRTGKEAEEFLSRMMQEAYPELTPNIRLIPGSRYEQAKDSLGLYQPKQAQILINGEKFRASDIRDMLATTFHEAGHQYDDKVLNYKIPEELRKHKGQLDFKKAYQVASELDRPIDPTEMYNLAAAGHHARIPKLRDADSFGLGALKSYLKSGTFKGMAPVLAKGAAVGAGGLASLAAEASDTEEEGSSAEQAALLRDIDQRNREKAILQAVPEQNRPAVQDELEAQRLGLRRSAIEDLLRK